MSKEDGTSDTLRETCSGISKTNNKDPKKSIKMFILPPNILQNIPVNANVASGKYS